SPEVQSETQILNCRIRSVRGLLFFLLTAAVWAQPETIFPSESKDPKMADGARLLETVCPGRVAVGKEIECGGPCPDFTGLPEFGSWKLEAVTRGHFLSPISDDVALAMTGCESHSENWGGTILMTRASGVWRMLWYKSGVHTDECHKTVLKNKREILV